MSWDAAGRGPPRLVRATIVIADGSTHQAPNRTSVRETVHDVACLVSRRTRRRACRPVRRGGAGCECRRSPGTDIAGVAAPGRSFLALDIGPPVGEVGPLLHALSSPSGPPTDQADENGSREVILDAVDRRGRAMRCRVTVRRFTRSPEPEAKLMVLLDPLPSEPA